MATTTVKPLNAGVQAELLDRAPAAAGSDTVEFSTQSDSVLLTLFVGAITGTLTVDVYGLAEENSKLLTSFTPVTAPTPELVVVRTPTCPARVRVVVAYTGPCQYEMQGRAIYASRDTDAPTPEVEVIPSGSSGYTSTVVAVSTTATELFTGATRNPERHVLMLFNDGAGPVYLGPSTVTATGATKGLQLLANQFISMSVGDVPVYAIANSGTRNIVVQELA